MVQEVGLLAQAVLNHARSYLGMRSGDKRHKELIARYNAVTPYPVGYRMSQIDDWCAAFVTVMGDLAGAAGFIGRECGVQRFIHIFKSKGIWLGVVAPRPGDVIVFDWQKNGWADHIGFVESVSGNQVTTIEGNTSRLVARRTYAYNDWRVAGYARPDYPEQKNKQTIHAIASEVGLGKWGNGEERQRRLKSAGYDVNAVQKEVNRLIESQKKRLKSNEEIAKEVVQGKWGNGDIRKKRLREAGYDTGIVQKLVNRMV